MSKKRRADIVKDQSPIVPQNSKIKSEMILSPFKWTEKQQKFLDIALDKKTKIIICKAPPGVGKTALSVYSCLELMNKKLISDIIYLRNPIESSSKGLGFLPGEKEMKLEVFGLPMFDHLKEFLEQDQINHLIKENRLQVESIGYIKGRTYNVVGLIADEAEDLTIQELRLLMGRLGKFSKLFIIGDKKQSNIKNSGFDYVFNLFNDEISKQNGIHTFEFTREDCMRNDLTKFILERFDDNNEKRTESMFLN